MGEPRTFAALLKTHIDARKLRARGLATLVNGFFKDQNQPELADIKPASVQNWLGSSTMAPMLPSQDEPILQIAAALGLNRAQTTAFLLAADKPSLEQLAATLRSPRVARHPLPQQERLRRLLAYWSTDAPHNLPRPLTSFVGRAWDRLDRAIECTTAPHRLITLTGPGGVGKTRLAIEIARLLLDSFPDGVWFLRLDTVATPDQVLPAIARVVGLPPTTPAALPGRLAAHLRDRRVLLVLDNLEHLLASGPALTTLLAATEHLRILATSRAPLRVAGEVTRPVAPFIPVGSDLDALRAEPALVLFADRAQAADPHFALGDDNTLAIGLLAARLDGLPLALELAAARLRDFPFEQLQARFARALDLGDDGPRDLSPRQRSLRQAIAWSYDLLPPARQHLFRHLAALPGGGTLAAVAAVVGRAADAALIADLAVLADYHLVERREDAAAEPRHTLLNTIREFAHEQLVAANELPSAQTRLLAWCVALAERAAPHPEGGPLQAARLRLLDAERDNLRAALAHAERDDPAGGLRLAARLWPSWILGRDQGDGRRVLADLLARQPAPTLDRARACYGLGYLSLWDDLGQARRWLEEAQRLARDHGDDQLMLGLLAPLCLALISAGDLATAGRNMAEWRERVGATEDPRLGALLLAVQGHGTSRSGNYRTAEAQLSQARELAVRAAIPLLDCMVAIRLGVIQLGLGRVDAARKTFDDVLDAATAIGATRYQILAHYRLGTIELQRGQLAAAEASFMSALAVADDAEDAYGGGYAHMGLGLLALRRGSPDEACRLFALAFAQATTLKDPLTMFAVLLHWWQARWQRRESRAAFAQARKCIRLACRHGNERTQRELLGALAGLADDCGDQRRAADWRRVATDEPGCHGRRAGRAQRDSADIPNALAGAETWLARRAARR
jgi:predicted ATPase/tetratricopeptide (TPR) repeat protein